jgi:ubiquinone/menaquinone biosynthesis C-methylase UbiE
LNILDIGCGTGIHTIQLAKLIDGNITAMDNYQAFLDKLQNCSEKEGVADKIDCLIGDMGAMNFEKEYFDMIWAEGSIFIIGVEKGLIEWRKYLKSNGLMALTDLFWFKPAPPEELKTFFDQICPGMLDIDEARRVVERSGYNLIDHFQLPENAWWDNYYNPLEEQLKVFREKYRDNSEALNVIEFHQTEIDMYRKYSEYYGYIFFILEKRE